MAKKLRVGILFGGRSGEHEVSLLSAASILKAIDRRKFDVVSIGINKAGHWLTSGAAQGLLEGDSSLGAPNAGKNHAAGDPAAPPGACVLAEGTPMLLAPEPALAADLVQPSEQTAQTAPVAVGLGVETFGRNFF